MLDYCSIDLTQEQEAAVVAYLTSLVYSVCYELPRFPDSPMDWSCSKPEDLQAMLADITAKGGRYSWTGPDSTDEERTAHKAWREEVRQRLIARLEAERR